jgi:uncharacterized membrane protein (DUF485 family)
MEFKMNVVSMRRALTACVTILFATVYVSVVHAVSFTATLRGANEVPPNASTNSGTTVVNIDPASSTISWTTTTTIPVATGHHIHQQVAGVNGPVRIDFAAAYSGSVVNTTYASQILANPAGFYVNLHTSAFPGGELRGQLVADPITTPTLSTPVLIALALALAGLTAFGIGRNARK